MNHYTSAELKGGDQNLAPFFNANHLTTPNNLNSISVLGHSSHKQS